MADKTSTMISSNDIFHTLPSDTSNSVFPVLTFNATTGFRIKLTFQRFVFNGSNEWLEIGDGLESSEDRRLARFSGTDLPWEVTSVSNAAWIKINTLCRKRTPDFSLTIIAINYTSKSCAITL